MKRIIDKLKEKNKTISTMESCTGGGVANSITNIEGAVIDGSSIRPNKKKCNFSIHAGIGVHYGLFGQQVDVGPYVGAGISYNF